MVTNELLSIKSANVEDAQLIVSIGQMDHVKEYVGKRILSEILASIENPDELYLIDLDGNQACVGYAYLVGIDDKNQSVELHQLAIGKAGCGFGGLFLPLIFDELFQKRGKNRL